MRNRKLKIVTIVLVLLAVAIVVADATKIYPFSTYQGLAFFNNLPVQYDQVAQSVKSKTNLSSIYEENKKCFYRESSPISNGPQYCGVKRAYYFDDIDIKGATSLAGQLSASLNEVFEPEGYNVAIQGNVQPADDHFYINGQMKKTPYMKGICEVTMEYPSMPGLEPTYYYADRDAPSKLFKFTIDCSARARHTYFTSLE